ncbi:MAG: PAS domain S-box protein [Victivallaceae bacterium]|nr:PAS domain S-box protein [Victivallaceae bacterium]
MNPLQAKIIQLESQISTLEELLKVSEESFLKEAGELEKANSKLQASILEHERLEKEYRMLFESSADAIMIHDKKGYIDCNQAGLKIFGLSSPKQLLKKHPKDFSPPKQPCGQTTNALGNEHIEKAYREGKDFFEWIHTRLDGTPFPAEVLLSRSMYQGKTVLLSTVRDISERKQAEARLADEIREREKIAEKYRILFEDSSDAIMLHDEKRFIDCNKATLKLLGYSRKQFLELGPADVSPRKQPNGRASSVMAREHMKAALRRGMERFEWTCKRKDGSVIPVEIMLSRMEYPDNVILLAIIRDITERKRVEKEIRHINAIQKLILENSTLGIALIKNRIFEWVNSRVGELLQLPADKLQGHSTRIIYPSQAAYKRFNETAYPALGKGQRSDNVIELKRGDGSLFWGRLIGKALEPENTHAGSVWMLEDMTEEMQARKLAEENAQHKGRIEMANNVLHDIGNAMTSISTHVLKPQMEKNWPEIKSLHRLHDLFMDNSQKLIEVLGEEKEEALDKFIKALISSFEEKNSRYIEFSEKTAAAVGHVCSVLELQRHYLKENSTPLATDINIANMINDTLVMMAGSLSKRDIKVDFSVHGRKLNISGDQTRLIRVFLNIIKNICEAFDELESEKARILDVTVVKDEDKKEIVITFADNAVGVDPQILPEVFVRGFTTKAHGSGIGLHECRSIIESHGGVIAMKSTGKNKGATTIIRFPVIT